MKNVQTALCIPAHCRHVWGWERWYKGSLGAATLIRVQIRDPTSRALSEQRPILRPRAYVSSKFLIKKPFQFSIFQIWKFKHHSFLTVVFFSNGRFWIWIVIFFLFPRRCVSARVLCVAISVSRSLKFELVDADYWWRLGLFHFRLLLDAQLLFFQFYMQFLFTLPSNRKIEVNIYGYWLEPILILKRYFPNKFSLITVTSILFFLNRISVDVRQNFF